MTSLLSVTFRKRKTTVNFLWFLMLSMHTVVFLMDALWSIARDAQCVSHDVVTSHTVYPIRKQAKWLLRPNKRSLDPKILAAPLIKCAVGPSVGGRLSPRESMRCPLSTSINLPGDVEDKKVSICELSRFFTDGKDYHCEFQNMLGFHPGKEKCENCNLITSCVNFCTALSKIL